MSGPRGNPAPALRLGLVVFGVLLVLEVAEYLLGQVMKTGNVVPLAILAIAAIWPILRYYMHIQDLRKGDDA